MLILAWNIPLICPVFLKRSLIFLIQLFPLFFFFFALFIEEGLLAIPWNFAFSWVYLSLSPFCFAFFFPQLFVKHLQRTILPSRISLCCWSVIKSRLTVTPWTAACQAPLSSIISWSLLKFMSIELMMLSNHLILCRPLLCSPSFR